jgi:uncharacterized membrane protein YcaP (DUF421 family)
LLGKKELSQITPIDFVYLLVLGGLLEESVYDDMVSVWQVLYAIGLWAILIFIVEIVIRKFEMLRPVLKGVPSIIITDGKLDTKALRKNKLESEQLRSMLRLQGIFSLKEVKYAILEPNGQLSIMKHEASTPVTANMLSIKPDETSLTYLLVDEGKIEKKTLTEIGKDENWLRTQLDEKGYQDLSNIYYAEWSEMNGFVVRGVER